MTLEEIKILEHEIICSYPTSRELWQRAFDEYNSDNKSKLQLSCFNCFSKVLYYLKRKHDPKTTK